MELARSGRPGEPVVADERRADAPQAISQKHGADA